MGQAGTGAQAFAFPATTLPAGIGTPHPTPGSSGEDLGPQGTGQALGRQMGWLPAPDPGGCSQSAPAMGRLWGQGPTGRIGQMF